MQTYHGSMLKRFHKISQSTEQAVGQVLANFDFIGVVERMDESLVVLKLLLQLELSDILHVDNPSPFEFSHRDNKRIYQIRRYVSPGMKKFFQRHHAWKRRIEGDVLLLQAANRSLDLTIERLGRAKVAKEVAAYRHALKMTQTNCATAVFPCNTSGNRQESNQSCFMDSIGCAYECLDRLSLETA